MKKALLLLTTVLLLSQAARAVELGPNQLLMGHYTTDDLASTGWGSSVLIGLDTVATDITPDELALFMGGKIVAFRVGLCESTPISRVFVIPVTPDKQLLLDEMTEWPCNASSKGWNMIELETPYPINLPDGYSLRIGFDYVQAAKNSKPLSAVKVGTTYPSYHCHEGEWKQMILSSRGNLSLQCVVESDNFPTYLVRVRNMSGPKLISKGDDVNFTFETCNLGTATIGAGECEYVIAVNGTEVATITNPMDLTNNYVQMSGTISSAGLGEGSYKVTVTAKRINGEEISNPPVSEFTFNIVEQIFPRQMRLVEQFTATGCTHCPKGSSMLQALCNMRDDIAWVAVHQNFNGTDPFRTEQCDTIVNWQGCDGFPEASFDRTVGMSSSSSVVNVISYTNATSGANEVSSFLDYIEDGTAWSTVYINSTYDPDTRKAVITVNGDLTPVFDGMMGADSKLTVYITEDNLIASQLNNGTWVENYVHNNVLRMALGSAKGVDMNRNGNSYKNVFNIDIPEDWKAEDLSVVAFISRPLRPSHYTDIYVDNANKRKLGEYDEPSFERGDVDGDGKVNIDDITSLIDCLLNGVAPTGDADCYVDGVISIDDVTALIDYLLNGTW